MSDNLTHLCIGTRATNAAKHPGAPDMPHRLSQQQKNTKKLTAQQKARSKRAAAHAIAKAAQIEDKLHQEDLEHSAEAYHPHKAVSAGLKPPIVKPIGKTPQRQPMTPKPTNIAFSAPPGPHCITGLCRLYIESQVIVPNYQS